MLVLWSLRHENVVFTEPNCRLLRQRLDPTWVALPGLSREAVSVAGVSAAQMFSTTDSSDFSGVL